MFESIESYFGTERLMTIGEERQQKGTLLLEFHELKQQQALLRAQAEKHASTLENVAKRLRAACKDSLASVPTFDPQWFQTEGTAIAEVASKLEAARQQLLEKAQQLRQVGLGEAIKE